MAQAAGIGHNAGEEVEGVAAGELRAFVGRIERLDEERKALVEDISEVYRELKGRGFDAKIVRKLVSLRKKDEASRQEEEAVLDTYLKALGMFQPKLPGI